MWGYIILILMLFYCFKMYSVGTIKYYTYALANLIIANVASLVLMPVFLLRPMDTRNMHYFKWANKLFCWIYGITWEVRNPEIIAEERGAIVVSNHQSFLDATVFMLLSLKANKLATIVKKVVKYLVPFGPATYLCGVIFIDRNTNGLKNVKEVTDALIKDKTKILVYAEGTRNDKFPTILKFKKGAFNMAVDAQVPIIPLITSPFYFVNKTKKTFNDGTITLECLEPIPTKGLTRKDVPELTSRVHDLMQDAFIKLSKEVLAKLPADYPHDYHL